MPTCRRAASTPGCTPPARCTGAARRPTTPVEVLHELGIDAREHRSRPLSRRLVSHADLVLAMTRNHVWAVANHDPTAADRTFMVGEIVRLGERLGPRRPGENRRATGWPASPRHARPARSSASPPTRSPTRSASRSTSTGRPRPASTATWPGDRRALAGRPSVLAGRPGRALTTAGTRSRSRGRVCGDGDHGQGGRRDRRRLGHRAGDRARPRGARAPRSWSRTSTRPAATRPSGSIADAGGRAIFVRYRRGRSPIARGDVRGGRARARRRRHRAQQRGPGLRLSRSGPTSRPRR